MSITRLIYSFCLKAFFPKGSGNATVRSERKSQIRGPVNLEKSWRATITMVRITKLIRIFGFILGNRCNITGNDLFSPWVSSRMYRSPRINGERIFLRKNNSQQPKVVLGELKRTMGNPKDRKIYGFGGFVVGLTTRREPEIQQFRLYCSIIPEGCAAVKTGTDVQKVTHVIHDIANIENLIRAYQHIKSNSGNETFGVDNIILDDVSLEWLNRIRTDLLAGKFKFSPVRTVHLSKSGNEKTRSLKVFNLRDKIVQMAIFQVLESIFEQRFLDSSHGCRSKKGCHTALRSLKYKFSNSIWVIQGDISKDSDQIDYNILFGIIKKTLKCDKTVALIKKSLEDSSSDGGRLNAFKGSPLSSLLCNIYFHEMDLYVENLKKSFDSGNRRRKPTNYRRIQDRLNQSDSNSLYKKDLRIQRREFDTKNLFDPNFRRLSYIRYANNFVIGIRGFKKDCQKILDDLNNFLTKNLALNLTKSSISHFQKDGIFFLGTKIKSNREKEKSIKNIAKKNRKIKVRNIFRIKMLAPIEKILKKGVQNSLFKKTREGVIVPTANRKMVNYNHADIIQYYNSKIQGILNYYSFVDNFKSLGSIIHGLRHSCALTLALKYKKRYRSQIFKKFGKYLECKSTGIKLNIPNTFARSQKFLVNSNPVDILIDIPWNIKLIRCRQNKSCLVCGATPCETCSVRRIKNRKN